MEKLEIAISSDFDWKSLEATLESWAEGQGARIKVRRFRTPGRSTHWHITGVKTGMGTVEVTTLPEDGKLEVLVHENRRGTWAGKAYKNLAQEIREEFGDRE